MLKRLRVRGFKSLADVELELPPLAVLFGPNAAGKSNLLDAIQALSRIGTERTLADALREPIRGRQIEAFTFPAGGLPELLEAGEARFLIEADLIHNNKDRYRYRVQVEADPHSGKLSVADEYLSALARTGKTKRSPAIEQVAGRLKIHIRALPGGETGERVQPIGMDHSALSDLRLVGPQYQDIERTRSELSGWHTYYLDPRVAMRAERSPSDVRDIGVYGTDLAPFLYKLAALHPKHFQAVRRTLSTVVPGVEDLSVDMDKKTGNLVLAIRQGGVDYSSRIVSEGTLRILALVAITVNPWSGSLVAFEEPENGVHPRRLDLVAQLLLSLALEQRRQVVVATHSPLFCDAVLRATRPRPGEVGFFNVRRKDQFTDVRQIDLAGPLFQDQEIAAALATGAEDSLFENLVLRGWLDE